MASEILLYSGSWHIAKLYGGQSPVVSGCTYDWVENKADLHCNQNPVLNCYSDKGLMLIAHLHCSQNSVVNGCVEERP